MSTSFLFVKVPSYNSNQHKKNKWEYSQNFYGNTSLILFSVMCQWLVPKFGCKVCQTNKNRSIRYSVVSMFWNIFLCFSNIVHFAYARFWRVAIDLYQYQIIRNISHILLNLTSILPVVWHHVAALGQLGDFPHEVRQSQTPKLQWLWYWPRLLMVSPYSGKLATLLCVWTSHNMILFWNRKY